MMFANLDALQWLVLVILACAMLLAFARLALGPAAPDRLVAADTLGVIATASLALVAWLLGSALYLDVALVYGVLSFVGVVALARAIAGART